MATLPSPWTEHDRAIRPYIWSHRIVGLFNRLFFLGMLLFLAKNDRWINLSERLSFRLERDSLLHFLAYFACLGVAAQIVALPFDFAHYRIERRYKLSKQNFWSWLSDLVKGSLLGTVLGAIALSGLYVIYVHGGNYWWLTASVVFILFSILLAQLTPILFIPIFFTMTPLEPSPLKTRLLELCHRFRISISEIYHLGLGEKTEKGNAAFVGLGRTKRIIIGDTLYQNFAIEEVEAVFAHELGHQLHQDLWKSIGFSSGAVFLAFAIASGVVPFASQNLGVQSMPPRLALFVFVVGVLQIPLGLVQAAFSRWRERLADRFAAVTIGVAKPLSNALEKLTFQNKGLFKPNSIIEFISYSHPAPWRRILALRSTVSS